MPQSSGMLGDELYPLAFLTRPLSRVILPVFLLDEFLVDVRIYLRGADIRVPEEFLQHAQVHACLQAVRGKAVPEGMW